MEEAPVRVLVVDDQPVVAAVHREMVQKVPGFTVVDVAHDGRAALARVGRGGVDLVLLDLDMPVMDGLAVCRNLHALPDPPDVVVVTAMRDMGSVRTAVRQGAALYVLKPFTFSTLRERLEQYARFRRSAAHGAALDQAEIDQALATLRPVTPVPAPKTIAPESLHAVRDALRHAPDGLSAVAVAERTGMARVTARRYLEHLVENGMCVREPRYGRTGRPQLQYRLRD